MFKNRTACFRATVAATSSSNAVSKLCYLTALCRISLAASFYSHTHTPQAVHDKQRAVAKHSRTLSLSVDTHAHWFDSHITDMRNVTLLD